jgi:hypothetical protein
MGTFLLQLIELWCDLALTFESQGDPQCRPFVDPCIGIGGGGRGNKSMGARIKTRLTRSWYGPPRLAPCAFTRLVASREVRGGLSYVDLRN